METITVAFAQMPREASTFVQPCRTPLHFLHHHLTLCRKVIPLSLFLLASPVQSSPLHFPFAAPVAHLFLPPAFALFPSLFSLLTGNLCLSGLLLPRLTSKAPKAVATRSVQLWNFVPSSLQKSDSCGVFARFL